MKKNNHNSGQAHRLNAGQAMLISVIFFLVISLLVLGGLTTSSVIGADISRNLLASKQSYSTAESGSEDIIYRIINGKNYSTTESISLNGSFATTTITNVSNNIEIQSDADTKEDVRKIKVVLKTGEGASFHYGVQVGAGGLVMENNSYVTGNVYSNGHITGANNNIIKGDVVSAGSLGLLNSAHATGTAYSNIITNSIIDKDAYYQSISGSTVLGTLHPGSSDQPLQDLPISEELIQEWETAAASSAIISSPCPYEISSTVTMESAKINCNLRIKGNAIVTIAGPIWVTGNIAIEDNAIIKVAAALGKKSVAIIADNPANRTSGSKISIENNAFFQNSGQSGSYILLLSQNNSSETGGENKAIEIENNANGDLLLYAGHGEILLKNNVNLREVTAYKIHLINNANVIYETGLASALFESGPSSSFGINSWYETE
ncbi:MAG: hypothetical protein Q7R75_01765 [bacterium]|nr:hypothetical protein [bacterium]